MRRMTMRTKFSEPGMLERLRQRAGTVVPAYVFWAFTYEAVGRYASHLSSVDLFTSIDAMIPFEPAWVWIYALTYVVPFVAMLTIRDEGQFARALVAIAISSLTAYVVYIAYPVSSVRLPLGTSISEVVLDFLQRADVRANQLPSLHVSNAWILCAVVNSEPHRRPFRLGCGLIAAAITLSTLFVKQHSVLDVVAGLTWAGAALRLAPLVRRHLRSFYQRVSLASE